MKLTTCQIAKLLPVTAFFLNSPIAASFSFSASPTSASAFRSSSSHSHSHSERPHRSDVLVLRAAEPVGAFATNAVAASATLGSKSIQLTAVQTKSPRNAREAGRQERQMQQPAIQQQLNPPQQHQGRQQQQPQQQPQQKRVQHQMQRVGVLIPASVHVNLTHVQQGFQHFLDFFQLHLSNVTVDFLRDVGEYTQAKKHAHQNRALFVAPALKIPPTCI
uniref:GG16496 n=1 Tax=Drosophila erecta TaxID=7220 RepID=B3P223_DROER